MTIPQFSTPHCHPQSLDTASTPQDFVERELELGSGTVTATDHGSMGICRHVYDIGRKQGLTPILGLEAYVRDDDDPILKAAGIPKSQRYVNAEGERVAVAKWEALPAPQKSLYRLEEGYWDYAKYAHLTVHFLDQEAYETGVRLLSRAELGRRERHGSEPKPLWSWAEVEELAQKNVTVGSSCLAGMVQQHLHLHQDPAMAEAYYRRLHDLFRGRLIVEVFPHSCSHYYRDEVTLEFADGTTESFPGWKNLATSASEKIKAEELVKAFRVKGEHKQLLATMQNRVMTALEKPKDIVGVTRHEGFVQNECLPWCPDGDVQAPCNRFVLMLAKKYGDPVLVSDDSHFSRPEGQAVQNIRLLAGGGRTWRFYGSYHRQSSDEAFAHFQKTLGTTESEFRGWVENSRQWAERFKDFRFRPRLSLPTKFYPTDTVSHLKTLIDRTGRMHWQDPRYIERLQSEIQLLSGNGTVDLLPYFFLAEDSVHHVEQDLEGLTGPGRGSAAGMLTLYLIGVTHVNPLDYDLSQDRFLTLDRIASGKLPDVDQDYTGPAKEELTRPGGWLDRRFGPEYHAQISVDTKLKLRSSVKDVARVEFGSVPPDIEALAARMRRPPQGIEDWDFVFGYSNPDGTVVEGTLTSTDPDIRDNALIEYVKKYPKQWETVKGCLGLTRQKGRHASAIAITGEPIANFIPLTLVSEVPVTQYVASATDNSVEAAGAVKMDYLVINSLKDIEDCVRLIHKSEGLQLPKTVVLDGENVPWFRTVPWGGRLYDIWKLPNDDGVYASISGGDTDTVFQFCTSSARQWLQREFSQVRADGKPALASLENLAAFTALDRPGPLDAFVGEDDNRHNMLQEYARRVRGLAPTGETALLNDLCPETHGVIIYQEQLQRIFQEVGETTALEANSFRVHVSKKLPAEIAKDKIVFMRGALKRIPEAEAEALWEKMQSFAAYGFNKSILGDTILETCDGTVKRLKDFVFGDWVWGLDSDGRKIPTQVVALHDHGTLEGVELTFDDGYRVVVSVNHKFLTTEGMKSAHEISVRKLGVLCKSSGALQSPEVGASSGLRSLPADSGKDRGAPQDVGSAMRFCGVGSQIPGGPPKEVSGVLAYQRAEHQGQDVEAQPDPRAASSGFGGSPKDLGSTRYSAPEGGANSRLAKGASDRNPSHLGIGVQSCQEVQGGDVAAEQRDSDLAGWKNQMWADPEASRLRVRCDLGGGGRLLPLLRNKESQGAKAIPRECSGSRCDAERRGQETRCDSDSSLGGVFSVVRWQNEGRLASMAYSDAPLTSTGGLVLRRIVRWRTVGPRRMYDLEVSHPKHNFLLPNGVATSNSHAVCYALIGYVCAWLRLRYPRQWWCAVLNNATKEEIASKFWRHCRDFVDAPDIRYSGDGFQLEGQRIRAPISLLQGIGEKAQEQLLAGRPYRDIADFCDKIQAYRLRTAKPMEPKLVKDKKTGIETLQQRTRAGVSALNRGVVGNLIVCGIMDSLFPPEMTLVTDRLSEFERQLQRVTGIKPPPEKSLGQRWLNGMTKWQRYQQQKRVFPIHSQDLVPWLIEDRFPGVESLGKGHGYRWAKAHKNKTMAGDDVVTLTGDYDALAKAANGDPLLPGAVVIATVAYVKSSRIFTYAGGRREALSLVLDICGEDLEVLRWGGEKGLDHGLRRSYGGCIVLAVLERWGNKKGLNLADAIVVAEPLGSAEEPE